MLMNVLKRKTKEKGEDWLDHNFGFQVFVYSSVSARHENASLSAQGEIRKSPSLFRII